MCAISMISDPFKFPSAWPNYPAGIPFPSTGVEAIPIEKYMAGVTRSEFETLKRDVEALKKLLEAARAEDIANGEPDCEMEDKVAIIKAIAKMVGVDLSEVFSNDGT
jgi:peptidoglycan hydrolase-like amidase